MVSEKDLLQRKVQELTCLHEASKALSSSIDIKKTMYALMEILDKSMGLTRGTITILEPHTQDLLIEIAHGLSEKEKNRGRYHVGEGITGRVVKTGVAAVVPKIGEEPLFLNKTGARKALKNKEISFICVPIKLGDKVVGALSADKVYRADMPLEEYVKFLTIISSMVAQFVKTYRLVKAEKDRLVEENVTLRNELKEKYSFKNIVGNSSRMSEVYAMVARVAKSDATVLIRGESGTGKELIAHSIHYSSLRAKHPFIKVNCAALPESLIESELFGYERGAFTGALERKPGRFELAERGTIFLDEIGDLSPATQVKILRVIQEREFERLGGTQTIKCNVRLTTATNINLEEAVKENKFREDLYYRLNVFPVYLPPLRERKDDILLLAEYFLEKYARENHKDIKRISTPAIDALMSYHWPGNVRELENCMERSVLMCEGEVIYTHHFPPSLQTAHDTDTKIDQSLESMVGGYEADLIVDSLKSTKGNIKKSADMLKTTERVLGYKLKTYGIDYKSYRGELWFLPGNNTTKK